MDRVGWCMYNPRNCYEIGQIGCEEDGRETLGRCLSPKPIFYRVRNNRVLDLVALDRSASDRTAPWVAPDSARKVKNPVKSTPAALKATSNSFRKLVRIVTALKAPAT